MAAEIVDVAEAVYAAFQSTYGHEYIVKRAWSVSTLWSEWGTESEEKAERVRLFVVPVAAPRSELSRGFEQVSPTISIAVCKKTDDLCEQNDLISLAATILKTQRRLLYETDSGNAKVTTIEHVPFSDALIEKGIIASLIQLTFRMEVAHG